MTNGRQHNWIFGKHLYLFCIVLFNTQFAHCLEPLTIGATVGLGAIGLSFFKRQTYCRFYECCDDDSIPGNINELQHNLERTLFGQHIAKQHIIPALTAHFSSESKSRKPLVISFHGTPGTGKNFVADQIANALYKEGAKSKFVHIYLGRADFPQAEDTDKYKARINYEVRSSIQQCPRSLFIFDEVDKMPSGVFDTLTSLVDYNAFADGTDNTKAIFIFLSNTAGVHISDHLGKLMKGGKLREDTRLSDFEALLQKVSYNLDGGLRKTSLIEAHVIDHYMPFLPLEKSHVVQCLEAEFKRWNREPSRETINEIISDSITYDRPHGMFATSGCKTLEKKVAMAVMSPRA
ncbi:torsin-like protein [Scaptodrosophila lebanonensis]|uniref:Torsin-like protein n=1 Tax=Drosophila lebanonensis TaxID=7225 RepID=A0A6J2TTW6_DROLE|nr:torsin-like protein [Scaptodrosophila lebanonensis]